MFDPMWKLALGLVTGIFLGVLLQKGRVAKYEVIVGQFLLRDWTVVKVMATAVVVGMAGVYTLVQLDLASLHVKPLLVGGMIAGGVLFGIGIVLLGYCPGTTVAACGEGRRDAMVGLLGMLAGAWLFVLSYGLIKPLRTALGDYGKLTAPEATGTSPWLWIALAIAGLAAGLWFSRGRPFQLRQDEDRAHPAARRSLAR